MNSPKKDQIDVETQWNSTTQPKWSFFEKFPPGGDVLSIATSFHTADHVLIGTSIGIHLSTDLGQNWKLISGELGAFSVPCLGFSPDYPMDPSLFAVGPTGMILRSVDGGQTWLASSFGPAEAQPIILAISPSFTRDGFLLVGTLEDGIFRSNSRGRHWEPANFGLMDLQVWSIALSPAWEKDQTALAVVGEHLFRSTNGARAWKEVVNLPEELILQTVAFSPNYIQDGVILLGTSGSGIWLSQDHGKHWESGNETLAMEVSCFVAASSPDQESITWYAGTVDHGVLMSADNGKTWQPLGGLKQKMILSLGLLPTSNGDRLLAGVQGYGIYSFSPQTGEWDWIGRNLAALKLTTLAVSTASPNHQNVFMGGAAGLLLHSTSVEQHWKELAADLLGAQEIKCIAISPDYEQDGQILVGAGHQVILSRDGGNRWEQVVDLLSADSLSTDNIVEEVCAVAYSPDYAIDHQIWGCSNRRLFHSPDGGIQWTIQQELFSGQELKSLAIAYGPSQKKGLYLASTQTTENGWLHRLWHSPIEDGHWDVIWEQTGDHAFLTLFVTVENKAKFYDHNQILVATRNKIFTYAGKKTEWIEQTISDDLVQINSLLFTQEIEGRRFGLAGTSRGLFLWMNKDSRWELVEGGPGRQPILSLLTSPNYLLDHSVFCMSLGGLLWKYCIARPKSK